MVLENGRRYEVEPGTPEFRILEFDRYAIRVEAKEARGIEQTPKNMPIWDLMREDQPVHRAELLWRLGIPLSAIVLALLAIPLSFVNPRGGRSANMLLAILTYMIYNNFLSISQAWVAQGHLSFAAGVLLVHMAMLTALPLLFYRRIAVFSFTRMWR